MVEFKATSKKLAHFDFDAYWEEMIYGYKAYIQFTIDNSFTMWFKEYGYQVQALFSYKLAWAEKHLPT